MSRIRTIKPELFHHADLFDAEKETGLPLRLAWAGLFTACDREGRFKWKPRELKAAVLPYDEVDFSRVLDAWLTRGFVVKFEVDGKEYGYVPTWHSHQSINNRESASTIPAPPAVTRQARVSDASSGEGKGREGKGRELASRDAITSRDKATMIAKRLQLETPLKMMTLQIILTDVAIAEVDAGLDEDAVFDAMAGAWETFSQARPRLECPWGAEKFFGAGYWKTPEGWPWKPGCAPKAPSKPTRTALDLIREQEAADART